MQPIQQYFWAGINKSFEAFGSRMLGGELFSLFLENTWADIHAGSVTLESYSIQQLLLSAERGFVPAQAVVNRVFQSYEIDWPSDILVHRASWLFEGAAIGCPLAYNDLRVLDATAANRAKAEFYRRGGYQQYYYSDGTTSLWRSWRYDSLRPRTSLGIDIYNDEIPATTRPLEFPDSVDIHALSKHQLLYLSCLAGDSKAVIELCKAGADKSIIGEPGGATCLHWLFTFPEQDMEDIATLLMQSGNINAELGAKVPVPKNTFPFAWPPGTPLHWAVASSSPRAVNVLIKNGADCGYRNGIDPYMYDMDVRYFDRDGEDESRGMYSVPTGECLGMSPVELAVCSRDILVLSEFLAPQGSNLQFFETDEEGYTPFHRLQYNHVGRTANQHRFALAAFHGSRMARRNSTSKVISILKQIGGDINQLTKASPHNERRNDRPGSLTPLMLAVRGIDLDTVTALLEHGANVNVRNELGFNVLSQLPEKNDYNYCFRDLPAVVEMLLKYGAEVLAKDAFRDFTPLACAVLCGSVDVMGLLLAAGADPTEKSKKLGVMAWWVNCMPLWRYMLPWTRKMSWRQRGLRMATILTKYVFSRDTDDVRRILHDVDDFGSGLLHYAVASGHPDVVKAVLAAGGDKEARRRDSVSPIDRSLNTASWVNKMGAGTALEVCSRIKDVCIRMSRDGHEFVAPAGVETLLLFRGNKANAPSEYKFMVGVYDEIKEILVGDSQ
jgi:ankyrin repeat protein